MEFSMSSSTLSGVRCTVQECVYNRDGRKCTAEEIDVHGKNPDGCCDTECATFKLSK